MRILVKQFRRRVYTPDSIILDEQRHVVVVARCLIFAQSRLHPAHDSKRDYAVVFLCLYIGYILAAAINRFLFPESSASSLLIRRPSV